VEAGTHRVTSRIEERPGDKVSRIFRYERQAEDGSWVHAVANQTAMRFAARRLRPVYDDSSGITMYEASQTR
jgi:hypothetical protein